MKKIILLFFIFLANIRAFAQMQQEEGIASYYNNKFNGRKTASGEIFSNAKMTAAHNKLPLGTKVKVTNLSNGKIVYITINDRLHAKNKRLIDLSYAAAKELDFIQKGICKVRVEVIEKPHSSNQNIKYKKGEIQINKSPKTNKLMLDSVEN